MNLFQLVTTLGTGAAWFYLWRGPMYYWRAHFIDALIGLSIVGAVLFAVVLGISNSLPPGPELPVYGIFWVIGNIVGLFAIKLDTELRKRGL